MDMTPFRMHEVGTDSWCKGCGLVMKGREWPAFAEQAKGFPDARVIGRDKHVKWYTAWVTYDCGCKAESGPHSMGMVDRCKKRA